MWTPKRGDRVTYSVPGSPRRPIDWVLAVEGDRVQTLCFGRQWVAAKCFEPLPAGDNPIAQSIYASDWQCVLRAVGEHRGGATTTEAGNGRAR